MKPLLQLFFLCFALNAFAGESRLIYVSGVSGPGYRLSVSEGASSGAQATGSVSGAIGGALLQAGAGMLRNMTGADETVDVMTSGRDSLFGCYGKQVSVKQRNIHADLSRYHWYWLTETDEGDIAIHPVQGGEKISVRNHPCFAYYLKVRHLPAGSEPDDIF